MAPVEILYPRLEPYATGRFPVSAKHAIYYAEFGNRCGLPALFLHGGPGSGCNSEHARLFDPKRYRLIQLDQRGCGRARPHGSIDDNHTGALLRDIEALRQHLAIEQWLVYGGSWGGTLALEYAKWRPHAVGSLVLRAPFLARTEDLDWFTGAHGAARELPEAYATLQQQLGAEPDDDLIARFYDRLHGEADQAYATALAWDTWEAAVMGLPGPPIEQDDELRRRRIGRKRIYAHYCRQQFFLGGQGVLPGIARLERFKGVLIHGADDRVCLCRGSEDLVTHYLRGFELHRIADAGHALTSAALQQALREVLDAQAQRFCAQHTPGLGSDGAMLDLSFIIFRPLAESGSLTGTSTSMTTDYLM